MIGYGLDATSEYDEATQKTVIAFQRRWYQHGVTGVADIPTQLLIERVAGLSISAR